MTDYSAATINSGNAFAANLVRAVGAGRLQDIVSGATLTTVGTVTSTPDGFTFGSGSAIVLPDTLLTEFTILAWAFTTPSNAALVSRNSGAADDYRQNYDLRFFNGTKARGTFRQASDNTYVGAIADADTASGTLVKAVYMYNPVTEIAKVFVDGAVQTPAGRSAPFTSNSTGVLTLIGATDGTDYSIPYNGDGIQLVLILNKGTYSDEEITALCANPDQVFNLSGGGAPPAGTVTITSVTPGSTTASVVYSYDDTDEDSFEYRLDGGTPAAIGASPATITGLTAASTYDIEVRAVNDDGDGAWSAVESFTTTTPDTTPPTVTSVSGTDTGSTSATVSASSTEAGPGWAVLTPTSTQPSQAQVEAGQDHTGSSTGVFLDTATLAIGANPAAFAFTGLTPGATYWPHVVAKDTATPNANVSAVESGPSFTMPSPDVIDPVFAGGTTLDAGTKTNSSIALSTSAVATDNIAVTGYEWSSDNGATYPFTSLTNSFTFTALADLTSYNFRVRAYDGAGNRSAHLSLTTSTYRDGDTGQNIVDNTGPVGGNPEGFLRNKVTLPADAAKWFSYVITSMPATGSFTTLNPDGTFVFIGPNNETMLVQLEVDGANFGAPFEVSLYDSVSQLATPSNAVSTGTATRSAAIQTFEATAVSATSIGTATRSAATPPTAVPVQPVNAVSTGTAGRSFVRSLSRARAASWTRYPAGTAQSTYPLR